jgi:hypothetical protein
MSHILCLEGRQRNWRACRRRNFGIETLRPCQYRQRLALYPRTRQVRREKGGDRALQAVHGVNVLFTVWRDGH